MLNEDADAEIMYALVDLHVLTGFVGVFRDQPGEIVILVFEDNRVREPSEAEDKVLDCEQIHDVKFDLIIQAGETWQSWRDIAQQLAFMWWGQKEIEE